MRVGLKGCIALLVFGIALGYSAQLVTLQEEPTSTIERISVENASLFICPEEECADRLVEFIGSAEESVHVMIYSLTKEEIAEALVNAEERGLDVRVVMDRTQAAGIHSKDEFLIGRGVEVRIVDPAGYAVMHHKVSIVDGNAFSTGSFNYTENADSGSAENLLIIHNRGLAIGLEEEFERLWSAG